MSNAMSLGALAMTNAMRQLDIVSHNLANSNTNGFNRQISVNGVFENQLDTNIQSIDHYSDSPVTTSTQAVIDHSPGALRKTGNPLDIAIEGGGYFEFLHGNELRYGRLGSFSIDASGRLVNSQGMRVNGLDGDIMLTGGLVTVNRDGSLHEDGEYRGQLKLVSFDDPNVLEKVDSGVFKSTGLSPKLIDDFTGLRQGFLEASNVQAMDEMVSMILLMRNFEASSQVIKGYDEMLGTAISTIAEF